MLNRKKKESIVDYKLRICENKDAYDLTWEEVADLINQETGDTAGESKYRKWFKDFSDGLNYAHENDADETLLTKLAIKENRIRKQQVKLSTMKNEYNKWTRENTRHEMIADAILEGIESLPKIKVDKFKGKKNKDEKVMTLDLADMHFGREGVIHGLKGEVLAEYSNKILIERLYSLANEAVTIAEKENITDLVVFNLGDSIDGLLRLTQLNTLSMGVIDSVMELSEVLAQWLAALSQHFETINYHSVLGNHAEMRIGGIKSGELKDENLEKIISWFIKERMKSSGLEKRVIVHDAQFIEVVDVLGTNICITHGQNERNLENSIKDYSMVYGEQIHMLKTGHLHHLNNRTIGMIGERNIEYVQSPSICGIDEYSMKLKKTANAGSLITIFTPKGKYCTYEIIL